MQAEVLGGQCPQKQRSVTDGSCPLESEGCPVPSFGSPTRESEGPQVLKAGIKAWCTQSLFIESRCPETEPISRALRIASGYSLFRAGDSKWPVIPVQFSHGPESSGGRKWLYLWKNIIISHRLCPALWRLCR